MERGANAEKIEGKHKVENLASKKNATFVFEAASTPQARLRGLMFRKTCVPLFFTFDSEGIWPIHSFFVAFEFDAIYLDSNYVVSGVFHSVRPFTPHLSSPNPSKYLLELPQGSAKMLAAKIGDEMRIG